MSHTWVEVSRGALQHNIKAIRGLIGDERKLMAVVKANAYGHGLNEVASVIEENVDYFAVATINYEIVTRINPLLERKIIS